MKNKKCPKCKSTFIEITNVEQENLVSKITYPAKCVCKDCEHEFETPTGTKFGKRVRDIKY